MYARQRPSRPAPTHQTGTGIARGGRSNTARAEDLGLASGPPMGALHASPDHVHLGGDERVTVGDPPITLTTGQINALADYVGSPAELHEMNGADLERALVLIATPTLSAAEQAELLAIFPRYDELSLANDNHFAAPDPALCDPSGDGGVNHVAEIQSGMVEAIALASRGGEAGDAALRDAALVQAAWTGHFVADAYSAGHLFNKADVMARVRDEVGGPVGRAALAALTPVAAARIAAEGAAILAGWRYEAAGIRMPVTEAHLGALLLGVVLTDIDTVGNGIVLAIHEELGHAGVEVQGAGAAWRMFGDGALDPVSEVQCMLTIETAYDLVHQAFEQPGSIDPACAAATLIDRLPRPTEDASAQVRRAISDATTLADGGMLDAIVHGSVHMLDAILTQAGDQVPGRFVRAEGEAAPPPAESGPVPQTWLPGFRTADPDTAFQV